MTSNPYRIMVHNGPGVMNEIETLLEARYPLIAIETSEEHRAIDAIARWCPLGEVTSGRCVCVTWTITRGLVALRGAPAVKSELKPAAQLAALAAYDGPIVVILPDFGPYLSDPVVVRALRETIEAFRTGAHARSIVLIGPSIKLPVEIERYGAIVDMPLPDRDALRALALNAMGSDLPSDVIGAVPADILDALAGLTEIEAENALAKSRAVTGDGGLDASVLRAEKKQIARKSGGVLDFVETDVRVEDVGGLDDLKAWIVERRVATTSEARAAGIRPPKGFVTVGPTGVGKSMVAKATASILGRPLVRGDLGAVKGGIVGASEANMRRLLRTAEAMAPCVLWLDEIEKGFAGASGAFDSGARAGVFGTFLTWRQETKADVFVVATANDVSGLPPELLRRGRFDEIFFVDLPTEAERRAVFESCLRRVAGIDVERMRACDLSIDVPALARCTVGFSGAEIEYVVSEAHLAAFIQGAPLATEILARAKARTIPLSETMSERIEALREWAKGRARPASRPEASATPAPVLASASAVPRRGGRFS